MSAAARVLALRSLRCLALLGRRAAAVWRIVRACERALRVTRLFRRDALPFMEAVDWESRELLEYPFVVSMPMDLKTLEERLCDGFYKSADEFARDARRVFANVLSFNSPEDQVFGK